MLPKKTDFGWACAVDVGISTAATAVIVSATGAGMARTFRRTVKHGDPLDKLVHAIAAKQSKTRGHVGFRPDAARTLPPWLVAFVFEAFKAEHAGTRQRIRVVRHGA